MTRLLTIMGVDGTNCNRTGLTADPEMYEVILPKGQVTGASKVNLVFICADSVRTLNL